MPNIEARTPIDRYGGDMCQEAKWAWWRGFRRGMIAIATPIILVALAAVMMN